MIKQSRNSQRSGRRRGPVSGPVQYTVRNVPVLVDEALRRRAREEQKSLNEVLRDALIKAAGPVEATTTVYHDLDDLAGRWVDDPGFDEAIQAQDQVDESLWR